MSGIEIAVLTLSGLAAGMQAVSSVQQGKAAANAAEYNAEESRTRAKIASDQANVNEEAQRRKARQVLGMQRAALGETVGSLSGSAGDVYAASAKNAELDALNIRYQGMLENRANLAQASLDSANASASRIGGYMGAGSALLSGASNYAAGYAARNPGKGKGDK